MKAEAEFRKQVLKLLKPIGAFPIENADTRGEGTPDVCTVAGWIELKVADRPAKANTIVSIDLRNSQRLWLRRWGKHGGRAWTFTLLLRHPSIEKQADVWILHDGPWASEHLGKSTLTGLMESSIAWWTDEPDSTTLINALINSRV